MLAFVSINCLLVTKFIRLLIGLPFFQLLAHVWISWHCYCYLVMSLMAGINFSLVVGECPGAEVAGSSGSLVTRSFSREVLSRKGFCGAKEFDTE